MTCSFGANAIRRSGPRTTGLRADPRRPAAPGSWMMRSMRPTLLAVLATGALLAAGTPHAAIAAFPDDPPNDPAYDRAEENCSQQSVNDEQYYLYDRMSICTPRATDRENAAGMSVDRAWREFGAGRT